MPPEEIKKKVWVEISRKAIERNFNTFKSLVKKGSQIWSVVKSNAYGHGIFSFSEIANTLGVDGFCVDSVIEGIKLRSIKIQKPILVLGPSLFDLAKDAAFHNIHITISNLEALEKLAKEKNMPGFHLKIDTGMHRQGIDNEEIKKAGFLIKKHKMPIKGIYTHFASAKDVNYPTFTEMQFRRFKQASAMIEGAGIKNIIRHAAASGGTLLDKKYHFDAVRVGAGLYGLWPSRELEIHLGSKINLSPALSWHSIISEIKTVKRGEYVGYDMSERIHKDTKLAVIPIGYWHGFDRGLSSIGTVLINSGRAKVVGRVSMDLIVVDVENIKCDVGDKATLIGTQEKETLSAGEMAEKIQTTHYEIVTRINPLIERIVR